MEFSKWESYYENIIKDLGFSREKDDEAAQALVDLLKDRNIISLDDLSARIKDKDTLVFGLGPSLEEDADKVLDLFGINSGGPLPTEPLIVTADGATSILLQRGIDPHIIVSDLDGNVEDQVKANERGTVVIIHGHGDNIEALKKWVPQFQGPVLGTTQASPREGVENYGGFTDGDRAVYFLDHFKAKRIQLVSFCFDEVGGFKSTEKKMLKLKKLTWASVLIGLVDRNHIIYDIEDIMAQKKKDDSTKG